MNDHRLAPSKDCFGLALIAFFLFPLIGFLIGVGVHNGSIILENNPRWKSIPAAPSPPLELVYAAPGCVYITSVDENNYFFCDKYGTGNESWQRYDEIEHHYAEIPCPEYFPDYPYDDALQTIEFCLGKEYIDNTKFALLNDRSIKMRRIHGTGLGSFYQGVLLSLGGGVLGLLVGVGYFFYRKIKSEINSASYR